MKNRAFAPPTRAIEALPASPATSATGRYSTYPVGAASRTWTMTRFGSSDAAIAALMRET
jgi:hypothetical protein